jgi:uncharacterized phage protein gp47/JayE
MYEDMTFENILNSMLARVPDNLDKREGSLIYNALAPAAYELAQAYFLLENFLKLPFIDTSEGEYLTRICSQYGVHRKPATAAIRKGVFKDGSNNPFNVPLGSRFGIDGIVYVATKKISDGIFEMTCETLGTTGNIPVGDILPIDNIPGLGSALLSDIITYGEDEETDEALRERTLTKVQLPTTSGNLNAYKLWALSVQGVGGVKVFETWNGNGTVKLVLINTDKKPASSEVVTAVAEYIETVRPIGASVTVEAAVQLNINISVTVSRAAGYTLEQVTNNITSSVSEYLKSVAFMHDFVSYAKIGNAILEAPSVVDYSNLTVNGGTSNIPVAYTAASCQTPVLGTVTVNE